MPLLTIAASPCRVATATVATSSSVPGTTSPASWPATIIDSGPANARLRRRPHARRAVLAREHQLEQRRVLDGEGHVGAGEAQQPGGEVGAGGGLRQQRPEA